MQQSTANLACFIKAVDAQLSGMIGTYADGTICTEDKTFEEKSKITERVLNSKPRKYKSLTSAGIVVKKRTTKSPLH